MGDVSGGFWVVIGTGVGMVVASMLLVLVGSLRDWFFRMVPRLTGKLKSYPDKKDAEQNHRIYTELVELRALTNADRSYVVRFHNGDEFLPDNHVWKVTCTHEVAKAGVTYEASRLQAVLVSRIHGLVDPIITGESTSHGVSMIAKCEECKFRPKCAQENKHLVVIRVPDMDNSYGRFTLESHNTKMMVCSGVVRGGRAFGFVAVDFCSGNLLDEAAVADVAEKVCRSAEKVQYFFQNKKAPDDKSDGK